MLAKITSIHFINELEAFSRGRSLHLMHIVGAFTFCKGQNSVDLVL